MNIFEKTKVLKAVIKFHTFRKLEKETLKPQAGRGKKEIKIREETIDIKNRRTIQKINKAKT